MTAWEAYCAECRNMAPTKRHPGVLVHSKDRPDLTCRKHARGMSVRPFDARRTKESV